jgi:hypothetical protein
LVWSSKEHLLGVSIPSLGLEIDPLNFSFLPEGAKIFDPSTKELLGNLSFHRTYRLE